MTSELKPTNVGGLLSTDERNCWILANLEQVNIWNWFVSEPEVKYRHVLKLSKRIGENIVSFNRVVGKPYDSIISYSNINTGKSYRLAPISLKYILTKDQNKQRIDCYCPCECSYKK
jgi:hypothetical protein